MAEVARRSVVLLRLELIKHATATRVEWFNERRHLTPNSYIPLTEAKESSRIALDEQSVVR